jgi:hypothetical protein
MLWSPGAELVAHLPDGYGPYAQAREGPEHQGGGLVVAVADGAPGLAIRRRPDQGEAKGSEVGGGGSTTRTPD